VASIDSVRHNRRYQIAETYSTGYRRTIILHNILVEFGKQEPDDWIDLDDFSDMDEAAFAPYDENDELNDAAPEWAPKDTRRNQILQYFKE
jgi:hypothetical protein